MIYFLQGTVLKLTVRKRTVLEYAVHGAAKSGA